MIRALAILLLLCAPALARDLGQWEQSDPAVVEWYRSLKDRSGYSCCGEADAYWCGSIYSKAGETYCEIDDDRVIPSRSIQRHKQVFKVPSEALVFSQGNPTGRVVIFIGANDRIICLALNGGT